MKKTLITLAIVLLAVVAQAQIKMHSNGRITFQSWSTSFNGSVHFKDDAIFRKIVNNYGWMDCALVNTDKALTWVVTPDWSSATFYVRGDGIAYATNHYTIQNNSGHSKGSESIDGEEALSIVTGLNGYYYDPEEQEIPVLEGNENVAPEAVEAMYADFGKRTAGLSGRNLEEVFPEAVRTDPQNRLCIDYQSVVTMLVEAVKEQQHEIEELRTALNSHEKVYLPLRHDVAEFEHDGADRLERQELGSGSH